MIQTPTRLERGITTPYVSPKADWDRHPGLAATPELLVEVPPSSRAVRRIRHRDVVWTARNNRRKAFRQQQRARHVEQNLRGMARVQILGHGSLAMQENVHRHLGDLAEKQAKAQGIPFITALDQAHENLAKLLVAYGELEPEEA